MCLRVNIAINTIVYYIYVWIFQNGVEFEAKLFRLPAGTPGIIFFAGQPWSEMPCRLSGRKPASQTPARWLGCVLTDCLWLIEGKIQCIFWEKCQGASVDIHTIFKNPDIYMQTIRKPRPKQLQ